jgi:hypothetical protein
MINWRNPLKVRPKDGQQIFYLEFHSKLKPGSFEIKGGEFESHPTGDIVCNNDDFGEGTQTFEWPTDSIHQDAVAAWIPYEELNLPGWVVNAYDDINRIVHGEGLDPSQDGVIVMDTIEEYEQRMFEDTYHKVIKMWKDQYPDEYTKLLADARARLAILRGGGPVDSQTVSNPTYEVTDVPVVREPMKPVCPPIRLIRKDSVWEWFKKQFLIIG